MRRYLLRPLPRAITRPLALAMLLAWVVQMGLLLRHTVQAGSLPLATDLASYGSSARWKGIYYHGEKIGFSVSQTTALADGYEIKEDGQLQLTLMGMGVPAKIRTSVKVDRAFALRSFAFSLDPGTGATEVAGTLEGTRLELEIANKSGKRRETRVLKEPPSLSLNLSRRLATEGLAPGKRFALSVLDPATLSNAPMTIDVLSREVLRVSDKPTPTFRLKTEFSGITSHSWITETGEVVREESPLGLVVVQETREIATAFAVPRQIRSDMYQAAAVVAYPDRRIDDPASVDFLRLSVRGIDMGALELRGAGQTVQGDVVELRDAELLPPTPPGADLAALLAPEPFIESDAPEIVAEASATLKGIVGERARAERLVRHVNAMIEKRPTVSLPSALEVLRTRVGDCNEHTALLVALARAAGIPARIAVGLVYLRGAFYYHAWAEVWLPDKGESGRWIPADPTLNQFPADLTHLRLARGGLDKQAAILGVMGKIKLGILEVKLKQGTAPVLVGRQVQDKKEIAIDLPVRDGSSGLSCWSKPK